MKILIEAIIILLFFSIQTFSQFSWDLPKTNLQILPDTISGTELRKQMVSFSQSLGVRCWYCHDDSKGKELTEINFESDIKPQKLIAREMIKLVNSINSNHISKIKEINNYAQNVDCNTCHRGYSEPKQLYQILYETYKEGTLTSALNKYFELKEKYFGGPTFEFRENSLNLFGYKIMLESEFDDALKVFKLNAELFPNSYNIYDSLGEVYLNMNEKNLALENYKKSLQLNPKTKALQKKSSN